MIDRLISFVGAGPGAADLITARGARRLADADIVVWASSLVPQVLLDHCRVHVEIHDSKTMTLEDVLAVYEANPDHRIVRLHSGDPSIYGAVQEQIDWCERHARAWEVVPGVTSVSAAAAAIGRELTAPTLAQTVTITRLPGRTADSMPDGEGVEAAARAGGTVAILLSAARPDEVQAALLCEGSRFEESTPAAVVVRASWPDEQVVATTVGHVADAIRETGATMTALVLVGPALTGEAPRSQLYSPAFSHTYRLRSETGSTAGRPSRSAT